MNNWWEGLLARLDWQDPMLLLALATLVVTAVIPWFVWRLGVKQGKRDSELLTRQASSLARQEQILARQRRDQLLGTVGQSSDDSHLRLLWTEIDEFGASDKNLLRAAVRANPALALPGSPSGVKLDDQLDQQAIDDYLTGLVARYAGQRGFHTYPGLLDFLRLVTARGLSADASLIAALVTGSTAGVQRPGHQFFRELVSVLPSCAGTLVLRVEKIDPRTSGGLRLNVLTGVLLGSKDADLGREAGGGVSDRGRVAEFRSSLPGALAHLLHRDNLRSFDRWSTEGSTEPVSATVAWLVRAVGWLSDTDDHLAMRMVRNLSQPSPRFPLAIDDGVSTPLT